MYTMTHALQMESSKVTLSHNKSAAGPYPITRKHKTSVNFHWISSIKFHFSVYCCSYFRRSFVISRSFSQLTSLWNGYFCETELHGADDRPQSTLGKFVLSDSDTIFGPTWLRVISNSSSCISRGVESTL